MHNQMIETKDRLKSHDEMFYIVLISAYASGSCLSLPVSVQSTVNCVQAKGRRDEYLSGSWPVTYLSRPLTSLTSSHVR